VQNNPQQFVQNNPQQFVQNNPQQFVQNNPQQFVQNNPQQFVQPPMNQTVSPFGNYANPTYTVNPLQTMGQQQVVVQCQICRASFSSAPTGLVRCPYCQQVNNLSPQGSYPPPIF